MTKYKLEYIWLDGYTPTPNLRGKTQIKEYSSFPNLEELPLWGFDGSSTMQAEGKVRANIDIDSLARAIHCINLGYFLIRHSLKPDPAWNDEYEIGQMADLLMRGAGAR